MVAAVMIAPHQGLVERFSTLSGEQDYNFNARDGRIEIWKRGIGMMLSHPGLGIGVTAFMYANGAMAHSWMNAHNAFVQIGAELGVGGLVAFTWAILAAFRAGWRIRRRTAPTAQGFRSPEDEFDYAFANAALCSLVTTVTAAMFLSMAYDTITLLAMAAPAAFTVRYSGLAPRVGAAVRGMRRPPPGAAGWRSSQRVPQPAPLPPANR
jgi:O-antigen ligase